MWGGETEPEVIVGRVWGEWAGVQVNKCWHARKETELLQSFRMHTQNATPRKLGCELTFRWFDTLRRQTDTSAKEIVDQLNSLVCTVQ